MISVVGPHEPYHNLPLPIFHGLTAVSRKIVQQNHQATMPKDNGGSWSLIEALGVSRL